MILLEKEITVPASLSIVGGQFDLSTVDSVLRYPKSNYLVVGITPFMVFTDYYLELHRNSKGLEDWVKDMMEDWVEDDILLTERYIEWAREAKEELASELSSNLPFLSYVEEGSLFNYVQEEDIEAIANEAIDNLDSQGVITKCNISDEEITDDHALLWFDFTIQVSHYV